MSQKTLTPVVRMIGIYNGVVTIRCYSGVLAAKNLTLSVPDGALTDNDGNTVATVSAQGMTALSVFRNALNNAIGTADANFDLFPNI